MSSHRLARVAALGLAAALAACVAPVPTAATPPSRAQAAPPGATYRNPVVAGDFADPSILRVGDEYWAVASGTGTLVEDPTGRTALLYPAYAAGTMIHVGRQTLLDEVTWDADAWPHVNQDRGPSVEARSPLTTAASSARSARRRRSPTSPRGTAACASRCSSRARRTPRPSSTRSRSPSRPASGGGGGGRRASAGARG